MGGLDLASVATTGNIFIGETWSLERVNSVLSRGSGPLPKLIPKDIYDDNPTHYILNTGVSDTDTPPSSGQ